MIPTSLNQLLDLMAEGYEPKLLFFWGHTPRSSAIDQSCLSQWFPATFIDGGNQFPTAEHYMMHRKAQLFGDEDAASAVLSATTPGKAKAIGRKVRGFKEDIWAANRIEVVESANRLKFEQNPPLAEFLRRTGTKVLAEASPTDRIWGIGMAKEVAIAVTPSEWQGLNLLGFALMSVRHEMSGAQY